MTLFIVAHRLSTLNVCDKVMVIDNGRLESFRNVQELDRSSDFFRSALVGTGPEIHRFDEEPGGASGPNIVPPSENMKSDASS